MPHPGHAAGSPPVLASIRTRTPIESTPSILSPSRCGNRTAIGPRSEHRPHDRSSSARSQSRSGQSRKPCQIQNWHAVDTARCWDPSRLFDLIEVAVHTADLAVATGQGADRREALRRIAEHPATIDLNLYRRPGGYGPESSAAFGPESSAASDGPAITDCCGTLARHWTEATSPGVTARGAVRSVSSGPRSPD